METSIAGIRREAQRGDMTGDYKKNPVEVGTKNADLVIDQVTQ
jgi:hypothetical protein